MLIINFPNKPTHSSYILEYIWIDKSGNLKSKYRTVYPEFSYERYHHIVAENWSSPFSFNEVEIALIPVAHYRNPFFQIGRSFLILCETHHIIDKETYISTESNFRCAAVEVFNKRSNLQPWFGIEQEYFLMEPQGTRVSNKPLAFAKEEAPQPQGGVYACSVGNRTIFFRKLAEKHYEYCLEAGLKISGINAEAAPSQWKFQIGPCCGISAGDELWVARYILHKLSEEFGVNVSFDPKPLANPWSGSGLHTNFSTIETRENDDGLQSIYKYIDRLSKRHDEHIAVYGDNSKRLNGTCSTSDVLTFSYSTGKRNTSIRIPNSVLQSGCGYLEDRRPASDADPYRVTAAIFSSACLHDDGSDSAVE
jgi:glutamine synthetase